MLDKLNLTLLIPICLWERGKEDNSVLLLYPSLKSMAMANNPALAFAVRQPASCVCVFWVCLWQEQSQANLGRFCVDGALHPVLMDEVESSRIIQIVNSLFI